MIERISTKEKVVIDSSKNLFPIMQRILLRKNKIDQNREHFWAVGLDSNNRILYIELVSKGTINRTIAEPQEVFCMAILKRAVSIIIVHNHPSGSLIPSTLDTEITERMIQVGRLIRIKVLDHLIISTEGYLSFLDSSLMKHLNEKQDLTPTFVIEDKTKKKIKIAKNKYANEIAKKLKKEGVDGIIISNSTGLSVEKIKGL